MLSMFKIQQLRTLKFTKDQLTFLADTLGEIQDEGSRYEVTNDTVARLHCADNSFDMNQFIHDVETTNVKCNAPDCDGPEDFHSDC